LLTRASTASSFSFTVQLGNPMTAQTQTAPAVISTRPYIRKLPEPDHVHVLLSRDGHPLLIVTENGQTRSLSLSNKVAEVLIANGTPYGN